MTPEYEYRIVHGERPEGAIILPAVDIDPASIVLADGDREIKARLADREAATDRILAIFRENGGEDMEFPEDEIRESLRERAARVYVRLRDRCDRWFLWNVSYPVRTWFHFRFRREQPLPSGRNVLRAMLRDAFSEAGITDADLPYPVERHRGHEVRDKPGRFDLFFNRKRLTGS